MPASFNTTDDAGARQSGEEFTEIPDETSKKPDSQVASSFSKLMAEVGGAWKIFIFMSFTASLFAFIYMVILRYLGGVIIWVSKEYRRGYHEIPQKACEGRFCHVMAFVFFFEMPQNRRISISFTFFVSKTSMKQNRKCIHCMFAFTCFFGHFMVPPYLILMLSSTRYRGSHIRVIYWVTN